MGAGHGFVGNAFALLRGLTTFSDARRRELLTRVATTTKRLAQREGGLANWPASIAFPARTAQLVQWCHGAPGFLMALATRLPDGDDELDHLFVEAGELIWRAGALAKGACFCHGTDGNAMALISLYKRTGDATWLERARIMGMQAIQQSRDNLRTFGRRRYTLWTGDLGLAVVLQACLDGQPHMPTLDFV